MNEEPRREFRPPQAEQSLTPPRTRSRRLSPAWSVRLVIAVLILIVLLIIAFQNIETIRFQAFVWTFHVRLVWTLLIALVLGYILGWLRPRFRPRRGD